MSRYSSDSDSSNYHRQGRRKKRSPSASSSDSGRRRRSKSSKHSISHYRKSSKKYRSRSYKRSRSRSKNSSRRSRSASKERHRRTHSREKYRFKYHYKSRMHSNCRSTKYDSRSSSSDSKNSTSSSNSSKSSSAGSKKNSLDIKKNFSSDLTLKPDEQLREKLLKAIKAAESADHQLKQQGVLPKCVKSRNDISNLAQSQPQSETLKDINADVFIPKAFKASKQGKEKNHDDLNISSDVDVFHSVDTENSVFHTSFFIDPKTKLDWWVKKLYQVRQRAIPGDP